MDSSRFQAQPLEARCLLSFNPVGGVAVGTNPSAIVSADFNNDGQLDLATANWGEASVSIALGDGTGGFTAAHQFDAQFDAFALTAGDFNNDGNTDLATLNGMAIDVLLGNGDGTFQMPRSTSAPFGNGTALAIGDLNSDGKLDLVISAYVSGLERNQGSVSVWLGDGQGGWASSTLQWTNSSWPSAVVVADIDNDGWLDVATANESEGLSVMRGSGTGGLSSPEVVSQPRSMSSIMAVDMTSDGILDLVTSGAAVDVYMGNGDGTFTLLASQNGDGDLFIASAAGDFDGDGDVDIVAVSDVATVNVLLGNGDGTLQSASVFGAGAWPYDLALGDFDSDGRADLAVADLDMNSVGVFLNDGIWNRSVPSLQISDASVVEGNSGTKTATFTVTLSAPSNEEVRVTYRTENGSAVAGSDYQGATGTIIFAPGQTTAAVNVIVNGDRLAEQNETFVVRLINPVNAGLADPAAIGTIADDEPRVRISDGRVVEGNRGTSYMTFTVGLSRAYDQPITISFATQDGTAKAGSDFQGTTGTLTFAPGETTKTVRIAIYGDTTVEPDESFSLVLGNAGGNALLQDLLGVGWITNDDKSKGNGKK